MFVADLRVGPWLRQPRPVQHELGLLLASIRPAARVAGGAVGTGSTSAGPVRVGLLGCGRIARFFHLRALTADPRVRLVAVAEPDLAARRSAAAVTDRPGCVMTADWAEVVGRPDVDAVVVTLPTPLHAPASIAAFRAGHAVYVEKPLAADLESAQELAAAWRASACVGMTGFNLRFSPPYQQLRAAVLEGRAGPVVGIRTVVCSAAREVPEWRTRRATGGGALLDLAVHHIDVVRWILGEVDQVSASLYSVQGEQDTALVDIRTAGGVPVQIFASATARQQDRFEVMGRSASLVVDRYGASRMALLPAAPVHSRRDRAVAALVSLRQAPDRLRAIAAPAPDPSFAAALSTFVGAVVSRQPQAPTIEDGVAAMQVVTAAEAAAREGRAMQLQS